MNALASSSIAVRLWTWAAALRVLKQVVPLETLVRMMHRKPRSGARSPAFERRLEDYLGRAERFPFRPPANCLERSLGAYRMLCAANAAPQLVVGFRTSPERRVEGHVWVTVDGRPVAEHPENVGAFTAIVTFDADARRRAASSSGPLLAKMRFK